MLRQRILTAIVLIGLFIPALFMLPPEAWAFGAVCVIYGCAWEWAGLSGLQGLRRIAYAVTIALIAGLVSFSNLIEYRRLAYLISILFWLTAAPWLLWRRPRLTGSMPGMVMGVVVLVPVQFALVELRGVMPSLLLAIMTIAWVSDSAAYFTGRTFGRRKLAPDVSPGKTWEGAYGAIAAVLGYAIICAVYIKPIVTPRWLETGAPAFISIVLLWLILASAGIIGDLLESFLKRNAGVKDSGALLPGHGGILDRVDALLPILPIAALFYLG